MKKKVSKANRYASCVFRAVEPSHSLFGRVDDLRFVRETNAIVAEQIDGPTVDVHGGRERALHAADQRFEHVSVRRHVLQGRRRQGQRATAPDGHAHPVGARAQQVGRPAVRRQPALGRRARVPGDQENSDGRDPAHHLRRMAAGAVGQKEHEEERVGTVAEGLQRRVQRRRRTDGQQQFRHRDTAVRQFHAQRDPEVRS